MTVTFINPEGRENTADLSNEQIEKLRNLDGYTVLKASEVFDMSDTFARIADFDLPEVPKVRIHRKPFEECESCSA